MRALPTVRFRFKSRFGSLNNRTIPSFGLFYSYEQIAVKTILHWASRINKKWFGWNDIPSTYLEAAHCSMHASSTVRSNRTSRVPERPDALWPYVVVMLSLGARPELSFALPAM